MWMTDEYGKMLYVLFDKLIIKGSFYIPPCSSSYRKFSNVPKETPSPQRKNVLSFDHVVQAEQMNDLY